MAIQITGSIQVLDTTATSHTISGQDFSIDYDIAAEERQQGIESQHEATYEDEESGFSIKINIYTYPEGAYNSHNIEYEGCSLQVDNLRVSVSPEYDDGD